MVCPKCGMEYQEWAKECSDCHVPLISPDDKAGKKAELDAMHPVKLVSLSDGFQADLLEGLLKEQGIPMLRRKLGSGGYMQAYMGFSVFGEEIYVDEADYERAKEVLGVLETDDGDEIQEPSRFHAGYAVKIAILAVIGIFLVWALVVLAGSLVILFQTT